MGPLKHFDAYPLIAYLVDEPAAAEVADLIRAGGNAMSAVNLAEAIDVAARVHGLDERDVWGAVEVLGTARLLALRAPGVEDARRAAGLRTAHYRRRDLALSLADCFLLAGAGPGDDVVTSDPAVVRVACAEGISVVPLPDSTGRRP